MAMKASILLDLVDRVTRPMKRIQAQFGRLANSAGLQRLRTAALNVGQGFGRAVESSKALGRRLVLMGGAAAGAAWGLERFIGGVTEVGDRAAKTARRLGVPVQTLQEWQYGARRSGLAVETFNMSLQRFTRRAAEAAAGTGEAEGALKFLGIQLKDAEGKIRPTTELLPEVADAMAKIEDPLTRVRVAAKLFDSEGVAMVNFLEEGSRGMAALAADARRAGAVMTKSFAKDAEAYNDRMLDFRQTLFGLRIEIVKNLLPAVTEWIERMTEMTQQNRQGWAKAFVKGLREVWTALRRIGGALKWTADFLGGWHRLALAVGALLAGPLLLSVLQLGSLLGGLLVPALMAVGGAVGNFIIALRAGYSVMAAFNLILAANPIGVVIMAVAALAGAVYLIYRNWGGIVAWFRDKFSRTKQAFEKGFVEGITALLNEWHPLYIVRNALGAVIEYLLNLDNPVSEAARKMIDAFAAGLRERFAPIRDWWEEQIAWLTDLVPDWLRGGAGGEGGVAGRQARRRGRIAPGPGPAAFGPNVLDDSPAAQAASGNLNVGALLRIEIDSQGRPRVRRLEREGAMDLDVDLGMGMAY